jgi:CRP-like cAMP-binding protein
MKSRYAEEQGIIYVKKGNPVDAENQSLKGIEAINSLFGWTEGEFEFSRESVNKKNVVGKSRMEITLEAMKMLDEGLIEKLGPVSFVNKAASGTDESVHSVPLVKGPLVDYMYVADEEDYKSGDTIVQQGKYGNWLWVVLAGIVEIRKETPKGPVTILRVERGAFIGNISVFLEHSSVRNYTAVAAEDVQLGVLDSQLLSMENAKLSHDFKKIIKSLDKRLAQCANRAVEIHMKKKKSMDFLKEKSRVVTQGDQKEGFFIVEEGNANVVRKVGTDHILLATIREKDFLGKTPFMDISHEPGAASIFASEDFKFKELPVQDLQEEYNRLSTTMKNIMENTANMVSAITSVICSSEKNL